MQHLKGFMVGFNQKVVKEGQQKNLQEVVDFKS